MTSADHRAEVHKVAEARRAEGRESWAHRVELRTLLRDEELSFGERCTAVAARINASSWVKAMPSEDRIHDLVDELKDADDQGHYEAVMNEIYDEADHARVFIS